MMLVTSIIGYKISLIAEKKFTEIKDYVTNYSVLKVRGSGSVRCVDFVISAIARQTSKIKKATHRSIGLRLLSLRVG